MNQEQFDHVKEITSSAWNDARSIQAICWAAEQALTQNDDITIDDCELKNRVAFMIQGASMIAERLGDRMGDEGDALVCKK